MHTVEIEEAEKQLSKLVDEAVNGQSFVIAKDGKPLVKVEALHAASTPRRIGFLSGEIAVPRMIFRSDGRERDRRDVRSGGVKFLLDTHLLLWTGANSDRISEELRSELNDPANELLFSAASLWEISIKSALGRRRLSRRSASVSSGPVG